MMYINNYILINYIFISILIDDILLLNIIFIYLWHFWASVLFWGVGASLFNKFLYSCQTCIWGKKDFLEVFFFSLSSVLEARKPKSFQEPGCTEPPFNT